MCAGSGLSAQAGYPNRFQVLQLLIQSALRFEKRERDELLGMLGSPEVPVQTGVVDEVAEIVASRVSKSDLVKALQSILGAVTPRPTEIFDDLKRIPFASALTVNWDRLLEGTFAARRPVIITGAPNEANEQALNSQQFIIAKLYGEIDGSRSFRFTTDDFRIAFSENRTFGRIISSLVETRSILFLGMTLASISNFFSGFPHRASGRKLHYALVPYQKNFQPQQGRFLARYGVRLIPYKTDPDYSAVPEFVAELRKRVSLETTFNVMPRTPEALLTEVRLVNIGPFEELALSMDSAWNVILGNNGSGKAPLFSRQLLSVYAAMILKQALPEAVCCAWGETLAQSSSRFPISHIGRLFARGRAGSSRMSADHSADAG